MDEAFRTIGQLAVRCGHYCWLEHRLFGLTGSRASASAVGAAEIRVFLSVKAARHAFLADPWRDRLPVRAGIDPETLIVAPPGGATEAMEILQAESDLLIVLSGLVGAVLPRLLDTYQRDLVQSSPVSEAPVRAVLEVAVGWGTHELGEGRRLLERVGPRSETAGPLAASRARLQRRLGPDTGIFPAASAS